MAPFASMFSLAVMIVVTTPIYSETTNVYFSDYNDCGQTYSVDKNESIQIEGKNSTSSSSNVFTSCTLLFRASPTEDTLCVKISKLTFNTNTLQLQYFDSLDPGPGVTPTETFDSTSPANTPIEICSGENEITIKLNPLTAQSSIEDVDLLITVFNMQGNERTAYMDDDCTTTFKLRDSTISVQNTNPGGAMKTVQVCHLYFEYVGTNPNKTVCLQYTKLGDNCNYSLKILDGPPSGFTQAQTYTCSQTEPKNWCSTKTFIQLELENTGSTALPENTFSIEVKDGSGSSVDGSWGTWGAWAGCSVSCGAGQRTRSRQCDNPSPQFGGSSCPGDATGQATCNIKNCPNDPSSSESSIYGSQKVLSVLIVAMATLLLRIW